MLLRDHQNLFLGRCALTFAVFIFILLNPLLLVLLLSGNLFFLLPLLVFLVDVDQVGQDAHIIKIIGLLLLKLFIQILQLLFDVLRGFYTVLRLHTMLLEFPDLIGERKMRHVELRHLQGPESLHSHFPRRFRALGPLWLA